MPRNVLAASFDRYKIVECIAQAVAAGYRVRTTIRSEQKKDHVLQALAKASPPVQTAQVEFVIADLLHDQGWDAAVKDTTLVFHTASPFPPEPPQHEDELIRPAVEGTLSVLRAAKASNSVRRVVVTSSNAAIGYGTSHPDSVPYTEEHWTDPEGEGVSAYVKSKTLAERAAWDYMDREAEGRFELTAVNPSGVFGPPLMIPSDSTTVGIVQQVLQGKLPAVPNISFGVVDVRDMAALHLLVATHPEAPGQRYLCWASRAIHFQEISQMLRTGLGDKARRAPTRVMPDFLIRCISYIMPQLQPILPELGRKREFLPRQGREPGLDAPFSRRGAGLVRAGAGGCGYRVERDIRSDKVGKV